MQILFRVEASETLGLGHLSRCRSLALEFVRKFSCSIIFAITQAKIGKEFLDSIDATVVQPDELSNNSRFDVVITDIPGIGLDEQERWGGVASLHVGINDEDLGPFAYDILIRPNLLNLPHPIAKKKNFGYWKGKEYIILHPDFGLWKPYFTSKRKVENILVCFGGSDPAGITLRTVPILRQLVSDIHIRIVVGVAFANMEAIKLIVANKFNMTLSVNCSNMAKMFSNADLAFISGGTLLYEACALGVPALVLCQNETQHWEAEIFARAGAAINRGVHSQAEDQDIISAIRTMVGDKAQRQKMSWAAQRLIFSDGTGRIVSKIAGRLGWIVSH